MGPKLGPVGNAAEACKSELLWSVNGFSAIDTDSLKIHSV